METNLKNEYVINVANTILQQLRATTASNVLLSWGVTDSFATIYNGKPGVVMNVNGRLLKGLVFIVLDDGKDLYEVYTMDEKTPDDINLLQTEVFAEDLGELIDRTIERGDDVEEYKAFCESERKKLFSGRF